MKMKRQSYTKMILRSMRGAKCPEQCVEDTSSLLCKVHNNNVKNYFSYFEDCSLGTKGPNIVPEHHHKKKPRAEEQLINVSDVSVLDSISRKNK